MSVSYRVVVVVEEVAEDDGGLQPRVTVVHRHPLPGLFERPLEAHLIATTVRETLERRALPVPDRPGFAVVPLQ